MRTFIALELSGGMREEFERLQGRFTQIDADVKWVEPRNIHLTLKFLGEVEDGKIELIKNVLDEIASQFKPFEISLFKLGAFPTLNSPRVIWVGVDKNCSEAEKMAGLLEEQMEKIGFAKEERPFSAHLTLGRVRSARNKAALKDALSDLSVEPKSCVLNHITLFQSTLTPKGPIYTPLHAAKFKL